MGFGFNLMGVPLLLLSTAVLLFLYFKLRRAIVLKILALMWIGVLLLVFTVFMHYRFSTPVKLTKKDIIGEYRIDTNFFPGKNAAWQYSRYKFLITATDSLLFLVLDKETVLKKQAYALAYTIGPPALWQITGDSVHHVIRSQPTLFRGHNKFYYVFTSSRYNNMFFRKVAK